MTLKSCDSSREMDEFASFEDHLRAVAQSDELNIGTQVKSCTCDESDASCTNTTSTNTTIYGVQRVFSSGSCEVVSSIDAFVGSAGSKQMSSEGIKLVGSDPIYNFFEMSIEDIGSSNIVISAPVTSFVLVNLFHLTAETTVVEVREGVDGITLDGRLSASRVLWNIPFEYDFRVPQRSVPFSFHGTWLGRRGSVAVIEGLEGVEHTLEGQMFVNSIEAVSVNFECGHFAGFASCDLELTMSPSAVPTMPTLSPSQVPSVKSSLKPTVQQTSTPSRGVYVSKSDSPHSVYSDFQTNVLSKTLFIPFVDHCWKVELFENGLLMGDMKDPDCSNMDASGKRRKYRKISEFDYGSNDKVYFKKLASGPVNKRGWSGSIEFVKDAQYTAPTVTYNKLYHMLRQFEIVVSWDAC